MMEVAAGIPDEAEGRRMRVFRGAFDKALKDITAESSFEEFKRVFPSVAEQHHQLLFDLYSQVVEKLGENAQAEFADICRENQICLKLNDLERLCEDQGIVDGAGDSMPIMVPPATTMPLATIGANRIAAKEAEKQALKAMLEESQKENREVHEKLEMQRGEVARKSEELQGLSNSLDQVFTASKQWANRSTALWQPDGCGQ